MISLYANENFPHQVVEQLRALGHDVITVQERGHASKALKDSEVLQFACAEGRAVITLNRRDFIALHGRDPKHAGIIVCTVDADFAGQAARIDAAIRDAGTLNGKLVRVNRPAR